LECQYLLEEKQKEVEEQYNECELKTRDLDNLFSADPSTWSDTIEEIKCCFENVTESAERQQPLAKTAQYFPVEMDWCEESTESTPRKVVSDYIFCKYMLNMKF